MWRLYTPEWVIVHTVYAKGADARGCFDLACQWARENLPDIAERDIQIMLNLDTTDDNGISQYWGHIKVFKNNMKGEFSTPAGATTHARIHDLEEYTIVEKESKEDHAIRNYGTGKP